MTYAIVDAMNGHDAIPGADGQILKSRLQIRRPGQRAVFIDEDRAPCSPLYPLSASWSLLS